MRLWMVARLVGHVVVAVFKLAVVAPRWTDAQRTAEIAGWARRVFALLGIRLVVRGTPQQRNGTLFAGNHVSWLDIYALLAAANLKFVAKAEVRTWPVVGWLARQLDTHFITRDKRGEAYTTAFVMAGLLRAGHRTCIFPEGTTSDGRSLRPFHAALFEPAAQGRAAIQPFAIRYVGDDGRPSDAAAFTGDMSIAGSLWRLVRHRNMTCEIVFLPAIETTGMGRRAAARATEDAVRAHLNVGLALALPSGDPARGSAAVPELAVG